jgi:hypothetical protein
MSIDVAFTFIRDVIRKILARLRDAGHEPAAGRSES